MIPDGDKCYRGNAECGRCISWRGLLRQRTTDWVAWVTEICSHSSGGCASEIKVSVGLVTSEGCEGKIWPGHSPWLIDGYLHSHMAVSLHTVFTLSSLCVSLYAQIPSFYKDISYMISVPHFKDLILTWLDL